MGKKLLFLVLLFCVNSVSAQFTTVSDNIPFSTTNQGMFGNDSSFSLNTVIPLFNTSWNESYTSPNTLQSTYYGDYGWEVSSQIAGNIGVDFYSRDWGDGSIDVNYPVNIQLSYPTNNTFDRGDYITIKTNYTVDNTASINTVFPQDGKVGLEMHYNMMFKFLIRLCFVSCIYPMDFDHTIVNTLPILEVRSDSVTYPCLDIINGSFQCTDPAPLTGPNFPAGFSGAFSLPNVVTSSTLTSDKCLVASGEDAYLDLQLELFQLLAEIPTPAKPYLEALSNNVCLVGSWGAHAADDACAEYTLFTAFFQSETYNKQNINFCPEVFTTIALPTPVEYTITDPNAGNALVYGPAQSDSIKVKVGNDINIKYPCNFEYMDIIPLHDIKGDISNRTYDSIAFSFNMAAISFHLYLYGFAAGENPDDSSYVDSDTLGFGPLWEANFPLGSFDGIEWFNQTWELPGFNKKVPGTGFRLNPREFSAQVTAFNDVSCYGENDGSISVQLTNGSPPYKYMWSDGTQLTTTSTSITNDSLNNNNHYVFVEDANGCMVNATQYIAGPSEPIQVTSSVIEPITCKDANNGSITITVFGGTPPYTYAWSSGTGTTLASGVSGGNQSVTITDSKGCSLVENFFVPEPDSITAQLNITHVACNGGNNGIVEIIPAGGTPPYTFAWSNGATTKIAKNWTAGNHSVTVSDNNGCSSVINFTINEPSSPLAITGTTTNITCYGFNDGTINAIVTGGVPPYSYQWSDSNFNLSTVTTATITNLYPSNWNLTVTDSNGCIATQVFPITQPSGPLSFTDTVGNVSCKNGSDGFIDITTFGGTPNYTYSWSNGATSQDLMNIPAGTYSVTITDNNGCNIQSSNYVITEPAEALILSTSQRNVTCKNDSNGIATVVAKGGTPNYTYLWNTGDIVATIDSLIPGNYIIQVTDEENCTQSVTVIITEPDSLLITGYQDSVTCYGFADGKITVNVTGGTTPYQMALADSTLSQYNKPNAMMYDSLVAALYYVTVIDTNNCIYTKAIEVFEPDTLRWQITPTDASCYGGNDGFADLFIWGGTPSYTQTWNDSNSTTTEDLYNAYEGNYTVVIQDKNLCTVMGDTYIGQPDSLIISDSTYTTTCEDNDDGKIEVIVGGGTPGYTFLWSNGETTQDIYNLPAGVYTLIVTDLNGCLQYDTATVNISYEDCLDPPSAFTPDGDGYNDTWILQNIENYEGARIKVFNKWGKIIYESGHMYTPWDGTFNGKKLPSATYYYLIDLNDDSGKTYTGPVTIVRSK